MSCSHTYAHTHTRTHKPSVLGTKRLTAQQGCVHRMLSHDPRPMIRKYVSGSRWHSGPESRPSSILGRLRSKQQLGEYMRCVTCAYGVHMYIVRSVRLPVGGKSHRNPHRIWLCDRSLRLPVLKGRTRGRGRRLGSSPHPGHLGGEESRRGNARARRRHDRGHQIPGTARRNEINLSDDDWGDIVVVVFYSLLVFRTGLPAHEK